MRVGKASLSSDAGIADRADDEGAIGDPGDEGEGGVSLLAGLPGDDGLPGADLEDDGVLR